MQPASVTGTIGRTAPVLAPFQMRGRLVTAIVLRLTGDVDDAFYEALDTQLRQAAQFFAHKPLVLDLENVSACAVDFRALVLEMRLRRLMLVGIQNATAEQSKAAFAAGLITLRGGRDLPPDDARMTGDVAKPGEASDSALTVTEPVRSGQRIFASAGDLIIVGSVSSGAEVMARGNIHIYGALRGRALAGARGDRTARIFCHSLEAELIAVAGIYRTCDDMDDVVRRQRAQVFLRDGALCIETLK